MRLIDTDVVFCEGCNLKDTADCDYCDVHSMLVADAVEVETIKSWLYEIAMNNTDNYLCDACEEIISRLDGLRVFARERKDTADD